MSAFLDASSSPEHPTTASRTTIEAKAKRAIVILSDIAEFTGAGLMKPAFGAI